MHPQVDLYITRAKQWQSEIQMLRTILLSCKLEEAFKWGQPCYTINDKNIVIIAPFKAHCDLGFFNGAALKDEAQILVTPGKHSQSSRQMRFTNLKDIEASKLIIRKYVKEAIENEKNGVQLMQTEKNEITVEELESIFKKDTPFKKAFAALTPGRQRAYLIHFSGAKQSETRINRINNYRQRILSGIGINDCTCGLSKRMPSCDGSHKQLNLKK
jgi:uncharacterized protein YdeI (YjbR/CyaY-like superfamily)